MRTTRELQEKAVELDPKHMRRPATRGLFQLFDPANQAAEARPEHQVIAWSRRQTTTRPWWSELVPPFPPKSNPRPRRGAYCSNFAFTPSRIRMDCPIFPISPR